MVKVVSFWIASGTEFYFTLQYNHVDDIEWTSGVGGNAIALAKLFDVVIACDIDATKSNMLRCDISIQITC